MRWKYYDFARERPGTIWVILVTITTVFAVALVASVFFIAVEHPRIAGVLAIVLALVSLIFFRAARRSQESLDRIREAYRICTCAFEDGDNPGCPWHHPEGRKDNGQPTISRTR